MTWKNESGAPFSSGTLFDKLHKRVLSSPQLYTPLFCAGADDASKISKINNNLRELLRSTSGFEMHLSCKISVTNAAMMSDARGTVLRLDVGRQLGLELEHGGTLLRLALEVGQLVQGLVRVHSLEVASANT